MKLIYQRAGALLGPPAGDSDLAMKTSADTTSVYFFLAFIKAMDSCKPDSFMLSQSSLSIFGPTLQFQTRSRGSYNISFQLHVFVFPLLQHPARSKRFFHSARAVHLKLSILCLSLAASFRSEPQHTSPSFSLVAF